MNIQYIMSIYAIVLISIICLICIYVTTIKWINDKMIFCPIKLTKNYTFQEIKEKYSEIQVEKIEEYYIKSGKKNIHSLLFKNSNSNYLVIYCHGNSGNIIEFNHGLDVLYKFGSIVFFDYRGYGKSEGYPSEKGLYKDVYNVWKFYVEQLKYNPKNIILWGMSLGCSVSLWLGQYIIKNFSNKYYPKLIIAQSGFYNLEEISKTIFRFAPYLLVYKFNNNQYIKNIDGKIPIILLHSKKDEMIEYNHSIKLLQDKKNCHFCEIRGSHNDNKHTEESLLLIKKFL